MTNFKNTGYVSSFNHFEYHEEGKVLVKAHCPEGEGNKYAKLQAAAPHMLEALLQVNAVLDYLEKEGQLHPDFVLDLKVVTNKAINKAK